MDAGERADLVARLFAAMTAKLEDAAAEAADGQAAGQDAGEQIGRADKIELAARDIGIMAKAVAAILRPTASD